MKTLAILIFLFGIVVLHTPKDMDIQFSQANDRAVAMNFCVYRCAALKYVFAHKNSVSGIINNALFDLPYGYIYKRQWKTYVDSTTIYVYGDLTYSEGNEVKEFLKGTCIGIAKNNKMIGSMLSVNKSTNARNIVTISLPAIIPNGSIVSVSNLK